MGVMDELRAEAEKAQKELKRGAGYVGWKDLDDGNTLVFDLMDSFVKERTVDNDRGPDFKYVNRMTSKYRLFDIDGNIIREGDLEADGGDRENEDDYYQMPYKESWADEFEDALDKDMTVCMMTAHELVEDWVPPGKKQPVSFHKCTRKFGTDKGTYGRALFEALEKKEEKRPRRRRR